MVCPGLHSIFSDIAVEFVEPDATGAAPTDGISFATCPEDVDVAEARGEDEPNFLSE